MTRVLHVAPGAAWGQALSEGAYRGSTRGADLAGVGYVHASTSCQQPLVLGGVYAGDPLDDHVLLVIDVATCEAGGSPVRWEVPEGGDQRYPHVHGPVPVDAVVAVLPLQREVDGGVRLPDLSGLDVIADPADR